jgi:hypothetical protein
MPRTADAFHPVPICQDLALEFRRLILPTGAAAVKAPVELAGAITCDILAPLSVPQADER